MSDTFIQANAAPPINAWFAMNVLFTPNPPVAPDSRHNAAPYSAVLVMNLVCVKLTNVAFDSIAPPL